jgi:hypothetical protein
MTTTSRRHLSVLALLAGLPAQQVGAQQGPAPDRLSVGLGAQAPDFGRSMLEVGYRRSPRPDAYDFIANLRFGRYSAADMLGSARAQADGFTTGARPLYAATFYGLQGPIPMLRISGAYARASVGLTAYLGQTGTPGTETTLPVRGVDPRLAPGMEFAVGIGQPNGWVRPWSEVRAGGEYLSRTGLRFVKPVIAVGVDVVP